MAGTSAAAGREIRVAVPAWVAGLGESTRRAVLLALAARAVASDRRVDEHEIARALIKHGDELLVRVSLNPAAEENGDLIAEAASHYNESLVVRW